jgi:hypothetical protein
MNVQSFLLTYLGTSQYLIYLQDRGINSTQTTSEGLFKRVLLNFK